MKALILDQVSRAYKTFCSLSRRDQIIGVSLLLLSLPLGIAMSTWLPRLDESQPWIGPSLCAVLFIRWMWHQGYPALKHRITEAHHEIAMGGLRQIPGLFKRTWNEPGLFGLLFRLVVFLLLLYPFAVVLRVVLPFVFHPISLCTLAGICSLAFIHWVWRWAYPALQQRLRTKGMGCVYSLLVTAIAGLAYILARQYLNMLTGVDPGNFPTALGTLTTFALVPAFFFVIALTAALIGFGFMVALIIDMPQMWLLPGWRITVNALGAFGVFAFCSLLVMGEIPATKDVARVVAAYTLVTTEFFYDQTCPKSSKERLVARLKDLKETKPPRALFAEQSSWGNVRFSIDTCE